MKTTIGENKTIDIKNFLYKILTESLGKEKLFWVNSCEEEIGSGGSELKILQFLGRVPSITGKSKILLNEKMIGEAQVLKKNWSLADWTLDEVTRGFLLLTWSQSTPENFHSSLQKYFNTADVSEMQCILKVLPLLPKAADFKIMASLGARSNIKASFDAIALNNTYPSHYFDIDSWNQMVLKAVFIESPLYKITGLDERANLRLATMLCDYAHERWAAGRTVNPELWRPVGPFIDEENIKDVKKLLSGNELIKEAAVLACVSSNYLPAKKLAESEGAIFRQVVERKLSWDILGEKWHSLKVTKAA